MTRVLSTVAACLVLATALAGCGGSGGFAESRASTVTIVRPASSPDAGLKVDATPDYANPSPSSPVRSGVVQIAYRNVAIQPDAIRVKVGSTIRWTNYDGVEHNVRSESGPAHFSSPTFGKGGTFEYKVTTPGVIHYECTLQPTTMNGTIEVVG